jgi:hypothetical protein
MQSFYDTSTAKTLIDQILQGWQKPNHFSSDTHNKYTILASLDCRVASPNENITKKRH